MILPLFQMTARWISPSIRMLGMFVLHPPLPPPMPGLVVGSLCIFSILIQQPKAPKKNHTKAAGGEGYKTAPTTMWLAFVWGTPCFFSGRAIPERLAKRGFFDTFPGLSHHGNRRTDETLPHPFLGSCGFFLKNSTQWII